VLQRRLDGPIQIGDARFAALRRAHEMRITPRTGRTTWWRECTLAPLELVDFRLEDKLTGKAAALASLWDMDTYGRRWRVAAVGILHLEVREDLRRLGIGRYFLSQIFRHLQEQFFILAEAQVAEKDAAAHALLRGVGFEQVDKGHLYQFEGEPDAS
jgi:GNAT superfamily N-acetyltransferase